MAQRYNLLVIDDEQAILDEIKNYFEKRDFKVETALSGAEGLEKLRSKQTFNVALIDLCMPNMNGIDVIKKINEEFIPVNVAILTGHGDKDEAVAALKLGAQDWFQKGSFTMEQLYKSVKNMGQLIPEDKIQEFFAIFESAE